MSLKHLELTGAWKSESHENLTALLEVLGASFLIRKAAPLASPTQVISFDGMKLNIINNTGFKERYLLIMLDGSEFSDEMFGNNFTATASFNKDGVITVNGKLANMDLTITRMVNIDGKMVLTTTAGNVVCTRVFVRTNKN